MARPCPCQDLYFNHFSWQARPACLRGDIFFCRQICLCTAARAGIASSSQERGPGKEPKQAQVFYKHLIYFRDRCALTPSARRQCPWGKLFGCLGPTSTPCGVLGWLLKVRLEPRIPGAELPAAGQLRPFGKVSPLRQCGRFPQEPQRRKRRVHGDDLEAPDAARPFRSQRLSGFTHFCSTRCSKNGMDPAQRHWGSWLHTRPELFLSIPSLGTFTVTVWGDYGPHTLREPQVSLS